MSYVTQEQITEAREMDVLTYLEHFEPDNLVKKSGSVYCTREHDSLVVSNGKWCWFSQGIGGNDAISYLMKVRNMSFPDAVERITGQVASGPIVRHTRSPDPPKVFTIPKLNSDMHRTERYLMKRGIDPDLIKWCEEERFIRETKEYPNVLFVGYDEDGKARYGAVRSITGTYKGDVPGSDKSVGFIIRTVENPSEVHVFESVPDLLSYITILIRNGESWQDKAFLSLGGIARTSANLPKALERFLNVNETVRSVSLHLDSDEPGRLAATQITHLLDSKYSVEDDPPKQGKDFNEYLLIMLGKPPNKKKVEVR